MPLHIDDESMEAGRIWAAVVRETNSYQGGSRADDEMAVAIVRGAMAAARHVYPKGFFDEKSGYPQCCLRYVAAMALLVRKDTRDWFREMRVPI